jgi:hypothetical protein
MEAVAILYGQTPRKLIEILAGRKIFKLRERRIKGA